MDALTPRRRAFAFARAKLHLSNVEAARHAGYSARSEHALEVAASKLAHDPKVRAAIKELGGPDLRYALLLPNAVRELGKIAATPGLNSSRLFV
jgi:hypothetical protein